MVIRKGYLAFIIFLCLITGCSNQIQEDIVNYYKYELDKLTHLESAAIEAFNSVTGDNYVDDDKFYDVLKGVVIPKYSEFLKGLKEIKPKTEEISTLHKVYMEAADIQYKAFLKLKQAVENQDRGLVEEANNDLNKARELMGNWEYKLEEIAKKNKVIFE